VKSRESESKLATIKKTCGRMTTGFLSWGNIRTNVIAKRCKKEFVFPKGNHRYRSNYRNAISSERQRKRFAEFKKGTN
jgi:hypothetical protein